MLAALPHLIAAFGAAFALASLAHDIPALLAAHSANRRQLEALAA